MRPAFLDSVHRISARVVTVVLVIGLQIQAQTLPKAVRLTVSGDVQKPLTLSAEDLAAYPHQTATLHERDGSTAVYEGVPLIEILKRAGVPSGDQLKGKALASYLLATARDSYRVTFALAELDPVIGNGNIIVADKRDGKPLSEHEGPLRLIAPSDKKPARCVRMLDQLQVVMLRKESNGTH